MTSHLFTFVVEGVVDNLIELRSNIGGNYSYSMEVKYDVFLAKTDLK